MLAHKTLAGISAALCEVCGMSFVCMLLALQNTAICSDQLQGSSCMLALHILPRLVHFARRSIMFQMNMMFVAGHAVDIATLV